MVDGGRGRERTQAVVRVFVTLVLVFFVLGLKGMRPGRTPKSIFHNSHRHPFGTTQTKKCSSRGALRARVKDMPAEIEPDAQGAGGLKVMVTRAKEAFGRRLSAILETTGVSVQDLAKYLGRTTKQVGNYTAGKQFPTGEGLVKLHILFGVELGEVAGTQTLETNIDRAAVRERLDRLT